MNERIQEMMELADKFAKENKAQTITGPGNNYFEIFHEKFAELIVQRCAELSDLAEDHDLHGSTIIKRHFGVTE